VTYIIVGGSSGLGRALAERFAAAGCELVLVSRDIRDTVPLANHLAIKYAVKVSSVAMDLNCSPLPFGAIDTILAAHLPLKGLLMPAGINDDNDVVGLSDENLESISRINYLAPCQLLNHYLPILEKNSGVVVGFGSVATARGRSRNAAYAAAKSALESYFESLAHYAANRDLSCQYYVLGYLDTNLAFAQNLLFPLASPDRVADVVFKRRFTSGRRFLPRPWYILYRVVQLLPWTIFKRLSF
jgi:decaprenylphospho-beta-D-erythro-pentofuranosid-2-ulose 2-reductase